MPRVPPLSELIVAGAPKRTGHAFPFHPQPDGTIRTPMHDYGSKLTLVYERGRFAVVKWPGCNHWSGNHMPWSYKATEYMLVEKVGRGPAREAHVIYDVEPGHSWRSVVVQLKDRCDLLHVRFRG